MRVVRPRWIAGLVVAAAVVVAGCGAPAEEVESGGVAGAFPVTIEHKFGATTIPAEPQRIVSIGFQEHDFLYAVGAQPVGVRYWYGPEDDVILPWAEDEAAGADPEILVMDSLNLEAVAALQPDLIMAMYSGIDAAQYEQLTRIAPVVAQSGEFIDYGQPWQQSTLTAGRAVGREPEAQALVDGLEARFDEVRAAHPQFAERSLVIATYAADGLGFFASQDPRSRFFTLLGFTVDPEFDAIAGDQFYGELAFEQAGTLDRDVVIWDQLSFTPGGRATVEGNALVGQLAVTRDDRAIYLEGDVESAFGWQTVLSLPFALDAIAPELARVTAP